MAQPLRQPISEPQSYSDRIRERVEADDVLGARALLAEALERGDSDKDILYWQRVLAPAKMIRVGGERDIDRTADLEWLGHHGKEYQHEWVAVLQGELIAHSASLDDVLAAVKQKNLKHHPLLHYINVPPEPAGLAEVRTYAEKIRILVEADWVGAARQLLSEALERGDHDEDLSGWQRVLAPAKVIRKSSS
ncbi:MAG TPA: DUF5678 domain-containing protein [Thermoanaerobaculia bacterium]|jgi:hypothetical protein|nr:DUF5678 domain-containing protein [Thermoanaerobaculia bacterium]